MNSTPSTTPAEAEAVDLDMAAVSKPKVTSSTIGGGVLRRDGYVHFAYLPGLENVKKKLGEGYRGGHRFATQVTQPVN